MSDNNEFFESLHYDFPQIVLFLVKLKFIILFH